MYLFISRIGYSPFFPVLHGGFLHFHFKIPRKKTQKTSTYFFSKAHYLLIIAAAGLLWCFEEMVFERLNREIKIQALQIYFQNGQVFFPSTLEGNNFFKKSITQKARSCFVCAACLYK